MQPSLTTSLWIAYAELTANLDLIKHYTVKKVAFSPAYPMYIVQCIIINIHNMHQMSHTTLFEPQLP